MSRFRSAPHRFCTLLPLAFAMGITGCDQQVLAPFAATSPMQSAIAPTEGAVLARIRAATARYHDVDAALAAGYVRVSPCVFNTAGSKAIHFQKPVLVDAVVDVQAPEVLLYEPTKNGDLRLVGVEFLIPAGAWDAFHSGTPMLGEQPFMDRRSPPFGAPIPNYALYVWLWRHNPNGMFQQYNPAVSCEFADVSVIG